MPEEKAHPGFVVLGTAGHVDHGKTALVRVLTGKNTDALKEEMERGISIDIDFAPLALPSGTLLGLVDVPGHERFVRNMLAGAVGMDAALLVIDINEGMKPQTYEHLRILELLGVRAGVVVLTKVDLAEEDWSDVSEEVIREALAETAFAAAPVVRVSSRTGTGIAELLATLDALAPSWMRRDRTGAFRLPVDKVFSVPGFGTVVSGTVWRGTVSVGDVLEQLPSKRPVRVRGIQVHGTSSNQAAAGQRAALNLTGVEKSDIHRGDTVATPNTLSVSRLLDVQLTALPDLSQPVEHRSTVHVHLATGEVVGRVLLLSGTELVPGESGYAQLLLDKPLVVASGDHFVVRGHSPLTTIGGGHVVVPTAQRLHRRNRSHIVERLAEQDGRGPSGALMMAAREGMRLTVSAVASALSKTSTEANEWLKSLEHAGDIQALASGWFAASYLHESMADLRQRLQLLHEQHRLVEWVAKSTLMSLYSVEHSEMNGRDIEMLLERAVTAGWLLVASGSVKLRDWTVQLTEEEAAIYEQLLARLTNSGLEAPTTDTLCAEFPKRDRVAKSLLSLAKSRGELVEVQSGWMWARPAYEFAVAAVRECGQGGQAFTVAQVRDALQTSRKQAVALLEYLDGIGETVRKGDVRYLYANVTNS
ncbi:MAG: selenocysteine-specific translation elongation factor [Alicyclobacillaceae bacterium]|nr:selenocysteine-specific translation elongation factor [Alicyclobacillaceae bacterium]